METYKSGNGFCSLCLEEYGPPLVIYRIDDNGNPVLEDKEVLIIKPRRIILPEEGGKDRSRKVSIGIKGKSYQFLRGNVLS